jgi:hypothetical protein
MADRYKLIIQKFGVIHKKVGRSNARIAPAYAKAPAGRHGAKRIGKKLKAESSK